MKVKKVGNILNKSVQTKSDNKSLFFFFLISVVLIIVLLYFILLAPENSADVRLLGLEKKNYNDTVMYLEHIGNYTEESKYLQTRIMGIDCGMKVGKSDYEFLLSNSKRMEIHAKRKYYPKIGFWNMFDIKFFDPETKKEFVVDPEFEGESTEVYETNPLLIKDHRMHDSDIVNLIHDMLVSNHIKTNCLNEIFTIRKLFGFEFYDLNSDGEPEIFVYGSTSCNYGARRPCIWVMQKSSSGYKCIYDAGAGADFFEPVSTKHNGYYDIKDVGTIGAGTIEITFLSKYYNGKYDIYHKSEQKVNY